MQGCWKRYSSDRPHFGQILSTLNSYLDRLKRPDSVYYSDSESEEEGENNVQRQGSSKLPSRTPSIREGQLILWVEPPDNEYTWDQPFVFSYNYSLCDHLFNTNHHPVYSHCTYNCVCLMIESCVVYVLLQVSRIWCEVAA